MIAPSNARPPDDGLEQRAARVWPDHLPLSDRNRAEWLRAVSVVRFTKTGWLLDQRVRKEAR